MQELFPRTTWPANLDSSNASIPSHRSKRAQDLSNYPLCVRPSEHVRTHARLEQLPRRSSHPSLRRRSSWPTDSTNDLLCSSLVG